MYVCVCVSVYEYDCVPVKMAHVSEIFLRAAHLKFIRSSGRVRPLSKKVFWIWHKTASNSEAPILEICWMWSTSSSSLLPGSLWHEVIAPVSVPFMLLDRNTWYQITVYKNFQENVNINGQCIQFPNLEA